MRVEALMSRPVHCCRRDDVLAEAARKMWEHDVGSIVVTDGRRAVIGVLTDRDVSMVAYTRDRALSEIDVGSAMASPVHSVRADATVESAEELMRTMRVRRLPVVDEREELIGLLSINDLARHAAQQDGRLDRAFVRTVAAIGAPRPVAMERASSDRRAAR